MPTQDDYPEEWVCESEQKKVRVEVRVPEGESSEATRGGAATLSEFSGSDGSRRLEVLVGGEKLERLRINIYERPETDEFENPVNVIDEDTPVLDILTLDDVDEIEEGNATTYIINNPYEGVEQSGPYTALLDVANTASLDNWIEIPTESVELWVDKGDAAEIQRTAKVVHPTEWGRDTDTVDHNSPRRLITQYSSTDAQAFMFARVSFQHSDGTWVYTHLGWVGGVGGTDSEESGRTSKFWVYDFAELLTGVPLSATLNDPSLRQGVEEIARLTNDNTPIPVSGATIYGPGVEEAEAVEGERSPSGDEGDGFWAEKAEEAASTYYSTGDQDDTTPKETGDRFNAEEWREFTGADNISFELGSKTFVSNHDTLLDAYSWFEKRTDANVHFEPTGDGRSVRLVADVKPSRRTFTQDEVLEQALQGADFFEATALTFHEPVEVLKNNALYEMKPKNTVYLNGATGKSGLAGTADDIAEDYFEATGLLSSDAPSETYPHVKVQVPPLVDAADGTELAPELVESDANTLDQAEREAKRKMREILEEPSEGEIVLRGVPTIRPFDRVRAFEVCNEQLVDATAPVEYEVESVKHEKTARSFYTVRLRVSIWANDTHVETVEKTMVDA